MRKKPKQSGLIVGDKVTMFNCYESTLKENMGKVWTVRSESWDLCGSEVVLLEGKSGGFATKNLRKV